LRSIRAHVLMLRGIAMALSKPQQLVVPVLNAAAAFQDEHLRNLDCKVIEADEIWSFVAHKERNKPEDLKGTFGSAFSKKPESHMAAIALHFLHYNFVPPHRTLANPYPHTPAMTAGIADHIWTLTEIAKPID
jgi:hypothetical protein